MCGINGFLNFNLYGRDINVKSRIRSFDENEMHNLVHKMNECIIHRGPDHEGIYSDSRCALGMRRLSIIDIDGGSQPIWNEDHSIVIVFNGEIYNYRDLYVELKRKGHIFRTNSDTEAIVHGYEEWGSDVVCHLEGMFAFCIYDTANNKWMMARDRIGEKPFYYYKCDEYLIFGSELKSLVSSGLFPKKIDRTAVSIYFRLTYIPAPFTIYENVKKLRPGTLIEITDDGGVFENRYWRLPDANHSYFIEDYDEAKRMLRETMYSSIEKRMISDVPVGAFLSGGFDSSIVTGIMSDISDKPVRTFTIGLEDNRFDESELAIKVAQKHHADYEILRLNWREVVSDIDKILGNIDEPFGDSSLIATYAVSRMAKNYVTVVLTGDSGDELFAGYNKYLGDYYGRKYRRIPYWVRKGIFEPFVSRLPSDSVLRRKVRKVIESSDLSEIDRMIYLMSLGFKDTNDLILKDERNCLDFIKYQYEELDGYDSQTRNQYVDLCTVLEGDMLAKVDRASMLASLETRIPMLDYHLVELSYRLPTHFKINGKDRKIILKDTFKDLLPSELFSAPKRGFSVPIGGWMSSELRDSLYQYSDRNFIEEQGIFSYEFIRSVVDAHVNAECDYSSELWTYFVFQNWYCREIAE